MTQRLYIYPLLFGAAFQLMMLWRAGARWYWLQIAQLTMILLASVVAMCVTAGFTWVIIAWGLFSVFYLAPRFLAGTALRRQMGRSVHESARWWQWASRATGGNLGRIYRAYAAAIRLWSRGDRSAAETLLDELARRTMPATVRDEIGVLRLWLLVTSRDFPAAVEFYERMHDLGSAPSSAPARLLATRAYAEIGAIDHALWCLQFAALSLRTVGALEAQFWMARVCVAALAGDATELESLLNRRDRLSMRRRTFDLVDAYWRGRCALVRGDRAGAVRQLTKAQELVPLRNKSWQDAVAENLQRAESLTETPNPSATVAASTPRYVAGLQALHLAECETADWRALMHLGSPGGATRILLVVLACVFLVDVIVFDGFLQRPLWEWAGNIPERIHHGEWWRPVTALFLHANLLHLGMNGFALWLFGPAIERSMGRWRFLAIFLIAGTCGNYLSAMNGRYDVSVGASGGVFGVVAAFLVATYHLKSPVVAAARRRLLLFIMAMVAVDLTISGIEPLVDNLAHAGGFVAGLVLAIALYPRRARMPSDSPLGRG